MDKAGANWIVSAAGLRRWDGDAAPLVSGEVEGLLSGDRVTSGCPVGDGTFLLGTDAHGLLLVDTRGAILARYGANGQAIPTSGKISSLTPDAAGGVWITHYGGVVRAWLDGPTALHAQPVDMHARVESFALHRGRLHAATTRGVLVRDEADGRFELMAQGGIDAWALVSTEDGLIVAGDDLRLIRPDGSVDMIDARRLGFRAAARLRREPDRLVASTGPGGQLRLYRRVVAADGLAHWSFEAEASGVRMPLYPLVEDDEGWLWATRNRLELIRLDWRDGVRLDAQPERIGAGQGLTGADRPEFRVWIFPLEGRVEACNWSGLWRHDPVADRFSPETRVAGLDATRWSRAFPLADGSMWLANTRPEDPAAIARRTSPGAWRLEELPRTGLEAIRPSAVGDDPASRVWWIGHLGIASVDSGWRAPALPAPAVAIRGVETGAGQVLWEGAGAPPTVRLSPEEKSLRFRFAAPYPRPDADGRVNLSFRSRLDGFDSDWSAWTDITRRFYSNLPPGKFVFRVQARDESGRVGSEVAFAFSRQPPWWRTPWAWAAYTAMAAAALVALVQWRTRRLRQRAERLEKIVAERTEELVLQNEELARLHRLELDQKTAARLAEEQARLETLRYQLNPHFLFNALASVSALIPPRADAAKTMVERLADFCRIMLQREGDDEHTTVGAELRQLNAYLEIEKLRWGELLEVETRCPPELEGERLPPMLLLPLVENAVKYGRATSPDRIGVRLEVNRDDDAVLLAVSNTGEWIEPGHRRSGVPSLGVGLENLRERLASYYPRLHELDFSHAEGWVTVTLRLRFQSS